MRVSVVRFKKLLSVGESNDAREWVRQFRLQGGLTPPRHASDYEMTFSRSSGPGGQNVNKVNTKSSIRLELEKARHWLPDHALQALVDSPFYAKSSHSVMLSSMRHRTQSENAQDCLKKLEDLVIEAAQSDLQGATSHDKREHVKELVRIDKARTKEQKQKRSTIKAGRSKSALE